VAQAALQIASFAAMSLKQLRLFPAALAAGVAALGASAVATAAPNGYCDPLAGCKPPSHFVKVTPSTVKAGKSTTVSGAVGKGCKKPARVTIYSPAFKGATKHHFAGLPAIVTTTNKKGRFSTKLRIRKSVKPGRYHVGGRCGGGNFGSTTLRVK
jgi:hypothetical protein